MGKLNYLSKLYLVFVFIILYVPIGYLMFYSFNSGDSMAHFESFSFKHYVSLFQDQRLLLIVLNTIIIALLSATIATVIGVFGAIMIMFMRNRSLKKSTLFLNNIFNFFYKFKSFFIYLFYPCGFSLISVIFILVLVVVH